MRQQRTGKSHLKRFSFSRWALCGGFACACRKEESEASGAFMVMVMCGKLPKGRMKAYGF